MRISFSSNGCRCRKCRFMFYHKWVGARMFSLGRFRMVIGNFK